MRFLSYPGFYEHQTKTTLSSEVMHTQRDSIVDKALYNKSMANLSYKNIDSICPSIVHSQFKSGTFNNVRCVLILQDAF